MMAQRSNCRMRVVKMGTDRVLLKNDSDEPLELDPGESIPAILMFNPSSSGENVVHYTPRGDGDG